MDQQTNVIVCGDTTVHSKPSPKPLLYAVQKISRASELLIYVGDDRRDIQSTFALQAMVMQMKIQKAGG